MPEPTSNLPVRADRPSAVALYHNIFNVESPTYRERAFVSDPGAPDDDWGKTRDRWARYDVYWGMYEGTAYRAIQRYSKGLKDRHDLYDAIQAKRAPTKRIVDFATSKQFGGPLDMDAGDGKKKPSAIPIETEHDYLRPLIGQIWRNSLWATKKNTYARFGHALGDVFLECVDHPNEFDDAGNIIRDGKVSFKVTNPRTIAAVIKDEKDNIVGYVRQEKRVVPGSRKFNGESSVWATYIEICYQDQTDRDVIWYETFKDDANGERFDWETGLTESDAVKQGLDFGGSWSQNYGFVPMKHVQNIDVGKGWGWSDYQGDVDKLLGIDDLASKGDDQIRKMVDAVFLIDTPDSELKIGTGDGGDRDSTGLLHAPQGTTAKAMIVDLDIGDLDTYLRTNDSTIEKSFPVLATEDVSPDASGEARKVAREKVEAETKEIRANYDGPLVDIHKMCISMMIIKGYKGPDGNPIKGLDVNAYRTGKLDHSIGDRDVFAKSIEDKLDRAKQQADIVKTYTDAQIPLEFACILAEIPDEMVKKIVKAKDKADAEQVKTDRELQREKLSSTVEEEDRS